MIGATLNATGSILVRASSVGRDTTLAHIVRLVEEAKGSKAPIQRLGDTVSSYFAPAIPALAGLTFAGWLVLGPRTRDRPGARRHDGGAAAPGDESARSRDRSSAGAGADGPVRG